jgi:hypothetical protein
MQQRKLENISIVRTEHVQYDLMDYVTHRLGAQEYKRVEEHIRQCTTCDHDYHELLATNSTLKESHIVDPASVYYTTILPRVRESLVSPQPSIWKYGNRLAKIVLPLAVSAFLVVLFIRMPSDSYSESTQTEALHQAVKDFDEDDVVQAVEKEYAGSSVSLNLEVAAAGVAEHLQGDLFLKSAVSNQIENGEIAEVDVEGLIPDLNGEQVDEILSGLTERNKL